MRYRKYRIRKGINPNICMPFHALKEFIVSPVGLLSNNIYKYSIYRIRMQYPNLKICTGISYRCIYFDIYSHRVACIVYIFNGITRSILIKSILIKCILTKSILIKVSSLGVFLLKYIFTKYILIKSILTRCILTKCILTRYILTRCILIKSILIRYILIRSILIKYILIL